MSRPTHVKNKTLRARRVRARIRGTDIRPRLTVVRGSAHISGQLIDDERGVTLCAIHERELSVQDRKGTKTQRAHAAGALLAKKAKEKGIASALFDRGSSSYHGRVKAFAEGARQEGLQF